MSDHPQEEEWRTYWQTMIEACQRVRDYLEGFAYHAFEQDDRTYDAVVRNLEIIVRAGESVPRDVRARIDQEHWTSVESFRETIAESADRSNRAAVWAAAQQPVSDLLRALRRADVERARVHRLPEEQRRGRLASRPGEIPKRGWRDIGLRVWNQLFAHKVFMVAAGVAFYGLLSVFPALATLVSLYGLAFDRADVNEQLDALAGLLPAEAWAVLQDQLTRISEDPETTLSIGALVGFAFTLWSARAGVGALMIAMNIVYDEEEKRGIVSWYALSLLLTLGAILFSVVALALIVALPAIMQALGLPEETEGWVSLLRWPLLAVFTMLGLTIIYRYGPSRRAARWRWVTWGAVGATLLWLLGSLLFSFYIANFGNYNETYGSVGAVVVLMLWFYVTAFIVLLGAEFDAETEHQTRIDTTVGRPRPMGERGAFVADTLGRRP